MKHWIESAQDSAQDILNPGYMLPIIIMNIPEVKATVGATEEDDLLISFHRIHEVIVHFVYTE